MAWIKYKNVPDDESIALSNSHLLLQLKAINHQLLHHCVPEKVREKERKEETKKERHWVKRVEGKNEKWRKKEVWGMLEENLILF